MDVVSQVPLDNPTQVAQWITGVLPGVTTTVRGSFVVVGRGAATGVLIRPMGPGRAKLQWGFPSLGAQMILTVMIPLTGIIPGLLLFGLVWLVVSGGVGQLKNDIARVLSQGAGAPMAAGGPVPVAPSGGGGGAGKVFGALLVLGALMAFATAGYSYYEYDRLGSYTYGGYGSYGRYGRYGSGYDYTYWRRREHKERFQISAAAGTLMFLIGVVLLARKGGSAPVGAQPGGYPMAPMQGGYPQQGYPQQGYPQQGGYPQGYPSNPGMAPQQGYPSNPGMASQQGYAQPGYAPQGAPQGYPPNPGGWQGPQGGPQQ